MSRNDTGQLRIAITGDATAPCQRLRQAMQAAGWEVVVCESLTSAFISKVNQTQVEVVLLDMHDDVEHDTALLERLLDEVKVPVIFNDITAMHLNETHPTERHDKLMRKIATLTGRDIDVESFTKPLMRKATLQQSSGPLAHSVWVLGSSLGGPDAVKRFLRKLPADIPAAFVLAQHLGANFVELLARQLDKETALQVMTARQGHVLRHGQVVVVPADKRFHINPIGAIELTPLPTSSTYNPSIDLSIESIAERYLAHAGAIIFSGMCDDGRVGCQSLYQMGGMIWTQEPTTCVISSMPESVHRTGVSSFTGSPEQLAERLTNFFSPLMAESI